MTDEVKRIEKKSAPEPCAPSGDLVAAGIRDLAETVRHISADLARLRFLVDTVIGVMLDHRHNDKGNTWLPDRDVLDKARQS